jgi:hypothetical protein
MELLDDLRLPKARISDLLVGIWILNKGKLAPPAMPTVVPAPVLSAAPPALVSTSAAPPPSTSNTVPPATAPLQISPDVLAAEVASLTPEQIKLMLQTLSASNALPPAVATQNPISPLHNPIFASPLQPWQGNPAAYRGPYGPQHMQQPQPAYPQSQGPFNRYDQGHSNFDRIDHGGRGWNNDNRGRGRGRGRGYDDQHKPLDSGWAGSRSRGNRDGPSRGRARGSWT